VDRFDWALATGCGVLLLSAALTVDLVRAIWAGRPLRDRAYTTPLCVLLGTGALLQLTNPPTEAEVLVAAAAESLATAPETHVLVLRASGQRAWIDSMLPAPADHQIWAVIKDPRTGARWLQGPASREGSGWKLSLVLGVDDQDTTGLSYTVDVAAFPTDRLPASNPTHGAVRLSSSPASARWLARDLHTVSAAGAPPS
jgi:hypothetical protein